MPDGTLRVPTAGQDDAGINDGIVELQPSDSRYLAWINLMRSFARFKEDLHIEEINARECNLIRITHVPTGKSIEAPTSSAIPYGAIARKLERQLQSELFIPVRDDAT